MEPGKPGPIRRQPVKIPVVPYSRPKPKEQQQNQGIFSRIRSFLFGKKPREKSEEAAAVTNTSEAADDEQKRPVGSGTEDNSELPSASTEHPSWVADPNDTLRDFFEKKGNERLSQMEVVGVLSLIGQAVSQNKSLVDFSSMHLDSTNASSLDITPDITASTPLPRREETPQNSIFRPSIISQGESYADLSTRSLNRSVNGSSPWASRRRGLASGPRLQKSMHPYKRNTGLSSSAKGSSNNSKSQSASALMSVVGESDQKHQHQHIPSRPSRLRESVDSRFVNQKESAKPSELFKPASRSLFDTRGSIPATHIDKFPKPSDSSTPAKQQSEFSHAPPLASNLDRINEKKNIKGISFGSGSAKNPAEPSAGLPSSTHSISDLPVKSGGFGRTKDDNEKFQGFKFGSMEAGSIGERRHNLSTSRASREEPDGAPKATTGTSGYKFTGEDSLPKDEFTFDLPKKETTPSRLSMAEKDFVESAKSSFTF